METVYVLVQCDLGGEIDIIKQLAKIDGIVEVRGTYGIYDVFCKVQGSNKDILDDILTDKIRKIPKIRSTITLHWIPNQGGK